jgi:phage shock protein A
VHDEPYPCDAIELLNDLERLEATARRQHEQVAVLRRRVDELEARIRRAIRELTS